MARPFKKGIACHGSMQTPPFSRLSFVDLNNDDTTCDETISIMLKTTQIIDTCIATNREYTTPNEQ